VEEYTITSIDDILPLHTHLAETYDYQPQYPYIEGYFFNGDLKGLNEEEGDFARWDDEYDLDVTRGIVKLPYCVYKVIPDGETDEGHQEPAELFLCCAFNAREEPMAGWWHYEGEYELDEDDEVVTGYGIVQVEEPCSFRCIIQTYNEDVASTVTDNEADCEEMAEALAESYAQHFKSVPQMSMQWNGIYAIGVDGNVHVMRWTVGGGPGITWGGKNLEYRYMSPSYSERKLRHEAARRLHL
jgi:hypothetical protein